MNLSNDLTVVTQAAQNAHAQQAAGVLTEDGLRGFLTTLSSFQQTYDLGQQVCPVTGQPAEQFTELEGVTMSSQTAMDYLAGDAPTVERVKQAKIGVFQPVDYAQSEAALEAGQQVGTLSPEAHETEAQPPAPLPAAPADALGTFMQTPIQPQPQSPLPYAGPPQQPQPHPPPQVIHPTNPPQVVPQQQVIHPTNPPQVAHPAAATPPTNPPPTAQVQPQQPVDPLVAQAAAQQTQQPQVSAAQRVVQDVEQKMAMNVGKSIPTSDGPVDYTSMVQLIQQDTGWNEPDSQAFLANLVVSRGHFAVWSQDPEWINRQLAYYGGGFGGVQDIEAPIVAMELQRKLGQNQGDPSLFLPEYLAPQLDNTVNVFVQSLRRIEQGLESQGIA